MEILLVAGLDMIHYERLAKALIRLRGCVDWSAPLLLANPGRQVSSRRGPYNMFNPEHFYVLHSSDFYPVNLRIIPLVSRYSFRV